MKRKKKKYFDIVIVLVCMLMVSILVWFVYNIIHVFFYIDFSQDYRKITGVENIVFYKNWGDQYYERCFWGLKKNEGSVNWEENESGESQIVVFLEEILGEHHRIEQAVTSPDGKYILYCEKQYGYMDPDRGMTDDEYCYYKVYDISTGEIITVYEGYRKWLEVYWGE